MPGPVPAICCYWLPVSTHETEVDALKADVPYNKWGKILTVIAVVSGVIIGALWVYQSYVTASNIPTGL